MKNEEILSKVDIFKLLEKIGAVGQHKGKEFVSTCPFPDHNDANPSFSLVLSGDKAGLWQCFSCGAKGNLMHLIQRVFDYDQDEAERWIQREFGFDKVAYSPSTKEISEMLEEKETGNGEEGIVRIPILRTSGRYGDILTYLRDVRGYTEDDAFKVCDHFCMQYVDSGYYKGRIIIPIYDSQGKQITFEACDATGTAEKKKLYPKGSPIGRLLYNQHNAEKVAWVVEGIWDAIRLWSFGEPAIATFGAKLSPYQSRIIINKFQDVFLMYDGDEAGRKAQERAKSVLSPYLNVYDIGLRFGDPDTLKYQEFREIIRWIRK